MKSSFSRKSASGASTWPSSIARPSPLAHHSLPWKPLPANSTASRTGASLAAGLPLASSPQTFSDSSQGKAIVTPRPRSIVRREKVWFVIGVLQRSGRDSFIIRTLAAANLAELAAGDNCFNGCDDLVVIFFQLGLHLSE